MTDQAGAVFKDPVSQDNYGPVAPRAGDRVFPALVVTVIAVAIGLRLWGMGFGLPDLYHEDEWRVVARALSFGTGNLHPGSFELGTLGMYTCFLLFAAYGVIGLAFGQFSSLDDFAVSYFVDPTPFYLIARGLFFVCGLLSIYLVFLIGRRLSGRWAGLLAAALVAVFPVHVVRSHLAFPDTMMLCFMAGALYVMVRDREAAINYRKDAIAGLLIGLGVAAKYTAVFMVIGYIVWRVWEGRRQDLKWPGISSRLAVGGFSCVLGFFIGMPYFFLDFGHAFPAIAGMEKSLQVVGLGAGSALHELSETMLSPDNIGIIALVCGGLGLMVALRRWPAFAAGLISIGALNIVWALRRERLMVRWLFATELVLCIAAGYFVVWGYLWLRDRTSARLAAVLSVVLSVSLLVMPLTHAIRANHAIASPDTRTLARKWIETKLPSGTKLLIVGTKAYNPQPRPNEDSIIRELSRVQEAGEGRYRGLRKYCEYELEASRLVSGPQYDIRRLKHNRAYDVAPIYDFNVPLESYIKSGTEYILTNGLDQREMVMRRLWEYGAKQFSQDLLARCDIAVSFAPGQGVLGPEITIWRVLANAPEAGREAWETKSRHKPRFIAALDSDVQMPGELKALVETDYRTVEGPPGVYQREDMASLGQ